MTAVPKPTQWITSEEYLDGERLSEVRHEFVTGQVYAMAGASDDHNRITGNILARLHSALRGKRCEPFSNDMKVKIPPSFVEAFYYPDVLVACDPTDNAKYFRERPTVIFEVLSPETERTDTREKAIAYGHISSVEAYVLVAQDRLSVTILHRTDAGWRKEIVEGLDAQVSLKCIGVEMRMEEIYERTNALISTSGTLDSK